MIGHVTVVIEYYGMSIKCALYFGRSCCDYLLEYPFYWRGGSVLPSLPSQHTEVIFQQLPFQQN